MNVLLLGNGFDIYHKLPTKYNNFLNVVDYLIKNENQALKTIGEVLGDKELQKEDDFIRECYEAHNLAYDRLELPLEGKDFLVGICKHNLWFSYLLKSFNKDVGWIDFEKEIAYVLEAFKAFLQSDAIRFSLAERLERRDYIYIISKFDFFIDKKGMSIVESEEYYYVKQEFIVEYPLGSGVLKINREEVINVLEQELKDLAQALRIYLSCFVNDLVSQLRKEDVQTCEAITGIDYTVTFNYTNTYESFYSENKKYAIHGNVYDDIILGINPDKDDEKETVNTLMISFKKYFQRRMLETDSEFWRWMHEFRMEEDENILLVMGHSLDVTDEDLIQELFYNSSEIYIFSHDNGAKSNHIKNLIRIFGKEEFDDIVQNKKIVFCDYWSDYTELKLLLDKKHQDRETEKIVSQYSFLDYAPI